MKFQPALLILVLEITALAITIWDLLRLGIQLVKVGWNGWVNILITLGAKYRRPSDVTNVFLTPPPATQKNIDLLKTIGFNRIGEAQVKLPFRSPVTVWVLANESGDVQAETAWKRVSFSTYFREKVLLVTDFPTGEHINTPTYQSHTITTALPVAYQYHLQQVAKFSQTFGTPHLIRNMVNYLRWEAMGRTHYGLRKVQRYTWISLVRLGSFLYGCLVLLLTPLLFRPIDLPFLSRFPWLSPIEISLFIITILVLPSVLIPRIYQRVRQKQTHQDSRQKTTA
jgi:hypothetical protein